MPNPVVTTLTGRDLDNNGIVFEGTNALNGWEITAWGFWWYKDSAGIGTKVYIAASGTPATGDFAKTSSTLLPYTLYKFQARCYYRQWEVNEEFPDGHWIYIEIFGDWVDFTTHAYSTTLQVFACDINKSTGAVTFWGSIDTPDDGHVVERGFQYGQTKTPGLSVSETGSFSTTGTFSLTVYSLPLDTDYYVRAYLKTASGHYFYTADGDDRGWAKFTTKILTDDLAVLSNAGFFITNEDFLRVFDKNGQENNAFKLPTGEFTSEVTVDKEGNAYYGWYNGATSYNISKRRLIDGFLLGNWAVTKFPRGVCIGYGDYIFTLETDTTAKNAVIYKRNISDLTEISHITLTSASAFFCGIIADIEDHVYLGRTTDPDRIEKYALYNTYNITGVVTDMLILGGIDDEIIWSEDENYTIARDKAIGDYSFEGGDYIGAGQELWYGTQCIARGFLYFDSSAISIETVIIKAQIILYGYDKIITTAFDLIIQSGMPNYPSIPNALSDFDRMKYSGAGGSINTADWEVDKYNKIDLNETGLEWINKGGITKFCARSSLDIAGIAPVGGNQVVSEVYWCSQENATEGKRPTLFIKVAESNFKIIGDHTLEFIEGTNIVVADSTGNDGIYTVAEGGAYLEGENTVIPVNEIVSNSTVDGNITRAGNLTMIASIETPTSLSFGGFGILDNYIYGGAWFALPSKADKALIGIEAWNPVGEWYSTDFFHIGGFQSKVIVEGTPYSGYSRALACYNENGTQLWKTDIVRGIQSVAGYPFPGEATLINIKAERDSTQTAIRLYGEIVSTIGDIAEKGFEYLIQDEEPAPEATGIEVIKERPAWIEFWEIGEYYAYEYEGNEVDFWDRLYNLEENTIWWFRAICKDGDGNKSTAETWMKNVPTMTTFECTLVESQQATANGELTDKGANIVTERGFRVIKEYVGDLFSAIPYAYDGFNCDNLESEELLSPDGVLIGFQWKGDLYRDSLEEGNFDLEIYEKILGGGFLGEDFGIYLKPNDTYKVQAIGVNELGMGFGEEVDLATGQIILPSDPEEDEIISETSAEKTITLGTIPDGCTVTRIGIRLGRTEGCTDIHVYEDGIWTSGGSHTFYITGFVPGSTYYKMPYIILNHGDYEEEIKAIPDYRNPERLEEWLTDYPIEVFPEVEDEDDLDQTVTDSSVGDISYRTIIKDIRCEKIGEQSFIDKYGRRRSQTINNHLIQTHENCKTIAIEYVEKFQILKMKIAIDYDIPIPFEREDVILLGDGKHKYREDEQGSIAFKADGAGTILQANFILAKIRKIDSNYISGTEVILSLELEV